MRLRRKKALAWALLLGWCAVIFAFSCQNSEASHETSGILVEPVMRLVRLISP